MQRDTVTTQNPFGVQKDQTDGTSTSIRDVRDGTRRQAMQKTGFPAGEILMNGEEIIRRYRGDKTKENFPELKEGIIL